MVDMKEKNILKALNHYWNRVTSKREPLFSRDLLLKALEYLEVGKNPFLYIQGEMEQTIKEKGEDYKLDNIVFHIRLYEDIPTAEKIRDELKAGFIDINLSPKDQKRLNIISYAISEEKGTIMFLEEQITNLDLHIIELTTIHEENRKKLINKELSYESFERKDKIHKQFVQENLQHMAQIKSQLENAGKRLSEWEDRLADLRSEKIEETS
jgi:hypothetical protein